MIGCSFQTSAPGFFIEKANSFCRTGVVVFPYVSSDALITDASGDWLLDIDKTTDFCDFIKVE